MRRRSLALPNGDCRGNTAHTETRDDSAHNHLRAAVGSALDHGADNEPDGAADRQPAPTQGFAPEHGCYGADETAEFVDGDDEAEECGAGVAHCFEEDGVCCEAGEDAVVVTFGRC